MACLSLLRNPRTPPNSRRTKMAVLLLAVTLALQQFAFWLLISSMEPTVKSPPFSWTDEEMKHDWTILLICLPVCYVFSGLFADSILNRCLVIIFGFVTQLSGGIWLSVLSQNITSFLNITAAINSSLPEANSTAIVPAYQGKYTPEIETAVALFTFGSAMIWINVLAMGADQFRNLTRQVDSDRVAQFIFGSMWLVNNAELGTFFVLNSAFEACQFQYAFILATGCLSLGLLVFLAGWWFRLYVILPAESLLLCRAVKVIGNACSVRIKQRRSGSNPEERGLLEAARYDVQLENSGEFSHHEVEGVRKLLKSLAILLCLLPYEIGMRQLENTVSFNMHSIINVKDCKNHKRNLGERLMTSVLDQLAMLVLLPILYATIFWLAKRGIKTKISLYIHIGAVLGLVALIITSLNHQPGEPLKMYDAYGISMSAFWIICYGASKAFAETAGLLLAYIWATRDIQGTIVGLFLAEKGIADIISAAARTQAIAEPFTVIMAVLQLILVVFLPKIMAKLDLHNNILEATPEF